MPGNAPFTSALLQFHTLLKLQAAQNTQAARQANDTGDAICTISLQDPPYHMSHADVNKLTLPAFSTLWTVSNASCRQGYSCVSAATAYARNICMYSLQSDAHPSGGAALFVTDCCDADTCFIVL